MMMLSSAGAAAKNACCTCALQTLHFTIDCSKPVEDKIMDIGEL
jgi:hypothetical protein